MLHTVIEATIAALLLIGAAFALVGSFGLAKLSDFYLRLHGPAKATTMGVGSALVASSLYFSVFGESISVHEVRVAAFWFVSAPVSAHMVIKAVLKNESDRHRLPPSRPDSASDSRPVSR